MLARSGSAVLLLVGVVAACGGSTSSSDAAGADCNVTADSCTWEEARLRSCAKLATGIYGVSTFSCAAHCPPDDNGPPCADGDITAADAAGHVTAIHVSSGSFASALPSGSYTVCAITRITGTRDCAYLTLAEGELVRVDINETESPAGIDESIKVYAPGGASCQVKRGGSQCRPGLGCFPGAAPGAGTCAPIVTSQAGEPCDLESSGNVLHACRAGLSCTTLSYGDTTGTCTSPSPKGGPCDAAHVCDPAAPPATDDTMFEPPLHCDVPSHTCVGQGKAGAWCGGLGDCNDNTGFECFDAAGHRPESGATGTCSARRAPNAACDQFYQCLSFDCVNSLCAPLLAAGEECIFATQCQNGVCAKGLCN